MEERIFEEVKTYIMIETDRERTYTSTSLVLERADGQKVVVGVFSGSGHHTQLEFDPLSASGKEVDDE